MRFALAAILILAAVPASAHSRLTRDNVQSTIDACNAGSSSKACLDVARALRDKEKAAELGLRIDLDAAMAAATRACGMGNSYGCETMAHIYTDRRYAGFDREKAAKAMDRGCAMGNSEICGKKDEVVNR